jgi:hypothetical protein
MKIDFEKYTSHPKFKLSDKYYFGEYFYSVMIDQYKKSQPIENFLLYKDVEYRTRSDHRHPCLTVYTSDLDFLDWIIENYKIVKICGPVNDNHLNIMINVSEDHNLVYRKRPYYGEYYFKLDTWIPWMNRNTIDENRINEIMEFISNLKDSKICHDISSRNWYLGQHASSVGWFGGRNLNWNAYPAFPKVYTNDEASLMLFKLMFSNDLTIKIHKVVTM